MHPLVRWQYRGGVREEERKAFLFTNVTDGKGRKYDIPVLVAGMGGTRAIYSVGMGRLHIRPLCGLKTHRPCGVGP